MSTTPGRNLQFIRRADEGVWHVFDFEQAADGPGVVRGSALCGRPFARTSTTDPTRFSRREQVNYPVGPEPLCKDCLRILLRGRNTRPGRIEWSPS